MCGRKMEDLLMAWSAQEGPSRPPLAPLLSNKRPLAPLRPHTADVETPGGVEVSHDPVVTVQVGQWLDDMGHMGGDSGTGTCVAQMPHALTRGHHTRGEQPLWPMTDGLLRACFRLAGGKGRGGVLALQALPTGLCSGADAHTALRKETSSVEG